MSLQGSALSTWPKAGSRLRTAITLPDGAKAHSRRRLNVLAE